MKLSIVVCVYNTDKSYLEECLSSIRNSTLRDIEEEYEICMVDDGSNIDYSDLVEKYALNYVKTENQGIYSARKTGAFMAQGQYLAFCDSDDTVSFNYHKPMLDEAESLSSDIVINDWAFHTKRVRYICGKDDTLKYNFNLTGNECLSVFLKNCGNQHSYFVLWNKIYKTEILRRAFIELDEAGIDEHSSYSEDAAINFFAWREASKIVNIHTGYYFYRIHESQTVNVISEEKLLSQINFMTDTLNIMERGIVGRVDEDRLRTYVNKWRALMSRVHYSHAKKHKYKSLFSVIKEKYGTENLKRAGYRESKEYMFTHIFSDDFQGTENALIKAWFSAPVNLIYSKKDFYAKRTYEYMKKLGKIDSSAESVTVPKPKNSLTNKIIFNPFAYIISAVVFKKGSKIRAFLKKIF